MRPLYKTALTLLSLSISGPASAHEPTALDGSPPGGTYAPGVPTEAAWRDTEACEAGDPSACYRLAERYHGGNGVPRDNPWSVELTRTACAGELARACYDLGARHLLGEYVEQDFSAGLGWVLRACELDDAVACSFAATLIEDGITAPEQPTPDSLRLRACGLGYVEACDESGSPLSGASVEGDRLPPGSAAELVELAGACDLGFVGACADLAERWESGDGLPVDTEAATSLRASACDWGLLRACRALGSQR
ncbi:MAG: TPR repeat protein [Bradymonadia bacterium]|jgi:TPR repeat protein